MTIIRFLLSVSLIVLASMMSVRADVLDDSSSTRMLASEMVEPPGDALSTGALVGTVIDADTRLPVENAKIEVLGTERSAFSQKDGQYKITGVDQGFFQIRAIADGYDAQVMNNIRLEPGMTQQLFFVVKKKKKTADDPVHIEKMPIVGYNPTPTYPYAARGIRMEGTVWLKLLVNVEGSVKNVVVTKSVFTQRGKTIKKSEMNARTSRITDDMIASAISAAKQWSFQPAVAKGKSIEMWVTLPFNFSMVRKHY